MRNLIAYPITETEVLETIAAIPEENPPGTPPCQLRIGGLNDLIRRGIIDVCSCETVMKMILEKVNIRN